MAYQPFGMDSTAAASLAGAVFGGAALLLGNWINRFNEQRNANEKLDQRIKNLKALIAAELVNVTCGLMEAKELMTAAIDSIKARGSTPLTDMHRYKPRAMPITNNLGAELLILEEKVIDALMTLRSDLAITQQAMDEFTAGTNTRLGLITAANLSSILAHNMTVLSEVFGYIAPNRKMQMPGKEPELVTEILKRAAKTYGLEDAITESRADIAAGRFVRESAEEHVTRLLESDKPSDQ